MKNVGNYKFASNLLIGAVCLISINSLIINDVKIGAELVISIAVFLFLLILAIIVRKGIPWLRYLFAFLIVFSLISMIMSMQMHLEKPLWGLINVMVNLLQIWALILLFKGGSKQEVVG